MQGPEIFSARVFWEHPWVTNLLPPSLFMPNVNHMPRWFFPASHQ
jgi:hypothetical protein